MIHPDRDLLIEAAIDLGRSEALSRLLEALNSYQPSERLIREITSESLQTLDEAKRTAVSNALHASGGNKAEAARTLEINIKTLYNMMISWGWHEVGSSITKRKTLERIPTDCSRGGPPRD